MNLTASPLRVIIVEDIIAIRQDLESFFQQHPGFIVIGTCGTVNDAIVLIHTTKPDLLLLDIGLPDGTGFDILEQITPQLKVIFLTAHNEYALKAIKYGAIDYLLKPLSEVELKVALEKVIRAQPPSQDQIAITLGTFRKKLTEDHIALTCQDFVQVVAIKQIIYLQGDNGYTTFFLNGEKKVVATKTLKDYEELLSDSSFLRSHQSYLVNGCYIYRYHRKEGIISLNDGTQIPVSIRRKEIVDQYFKMR